MKKLFLILFILFVSLSYSQEKENIGIHAPSLKLLKQNVKYENLEKILDSLDKLHPRIYYIIQYNLKSEDKSKVYECRIFKDDLFKEIV